MNVRKIIHVMPDDKFIDMAIREFEIVAPGIHEYVMIDAILPFRYLKHPGMRNLTEQGFLQEVQRQNVSAVMFHSLPSGRYHLLEHIPAGKKVFWFGWGFDYYPLLKSEFTNGLLFNKTKNLSRPKVAKRIYLVLKSGIKKTLQLVKLFSAAGDISSLKRIDYFSPVLDVEFRLVCEHNLWFTPNYICWNYGTVEDDLSLPGAIDSSSGKNLLVGNSASDTNNHIEIIDRIKNQVDLTDRKVIVPLSYGDSEYRDKVIRYGQNVLGDNFVPLLHFMPGDQYIQTLSSCGFVMMNHLRQQALGNICISILLGAKVYLHPNNPLYDWFKAKGVVLGNIEELNTDPLTVEERIINIKAVREQWGREAQREKTRLVVEAAFA